MADTDPRNCPDALFDYEDANEPSSGIYLTRQAEDYAHHRGARRRHRRWVLDATVRVDDLVEGVVLNASSGGLRVAVDQALASGSYYHVDIEAPSGPSRCRARVIWSRQSGGGYLAGLAFGRPDPRFRDPASFLWSGTA